METQQCAGISVPVGNIKVLIVAMEMQKWVPLPLSYSYKVLRNAVNNKCYIVWRVSVCLSCLIIRHAKRLGRIILSSVACLALPPSSTSSLKRHDISGGGIEHVTYVQIFSANFV